VQFSGVIDVGECASARRLTDDEEDIARYSGD
jgi:hypothetical protein